MSYLLNTYKRFPLTLAKGRGSHVWDREGRQYLDFCTGIATCCLGHTPPALVEAVTTQANTLIHSSNLYEIPEQEELAQIITDNFVKIPGKIFFSNSGTEANEGLIKSARRFGHLRPQGDGSPRYEILTFRQSFHGRTLGGMSATGQDKVKIQFDPLPTGFRHLPFNDLQALAAGIRPETAAILLEPLQGEGGVNTATPEFLRGVAELCQKHDLLFLLDEVQTGFCRLGSLMGWQQIAPEIRPDGISWAKGLGGGFPIGAFWLSTRSLDPAQSGPALADIMDPGSHGSTFGGNPLACAAALAVVKELSQPALLENVAARSQQIRATVSSWNHPLIAELRGLGLLLGLRLNATQMILPKEAQPAPHLVATLLEQGLLTVPAGTDTIRLLPALNVSETETKEALQILKSTLDLLTINN